MVEEGVMEDVDGIFGLHLWNELDLGQISVEAGPRMAAVNKFSITVRGKGGHGSMPHQGVDPITAASAIVMNLQSLVSRELSPMDPAVVSVGIFESGSRFNVLPEKA
jgi:amidohydrolase